MEGNMNDFTELTLRGRAMRLRKLALVALERYGLDVMRVRLLSNDFNGIFRVDTVDGCKYVLRVSLPEGGHSLKEIHSEMMWLASLQRDTDIGVPRPLKTRAGEWVTTVEVAGVPEPRHCVVFGWVPGPDLADRLTPQNVARHGALAALLHEQALSFEPSEGFHIKTANTVFPFGEPVVLFDTAYRDIFPAERRDLFRRGIERVASTLEKLYASIPGLRVLHYDLHQWNIKVFRGTLYPFDFEDLMWGYPVQDIAVALYYYQRYEQRQTLFDAFRQGYTRHSEWPEEYPGQIEAFMVGRALELSNFILQDPSPDYQRQAPAFIQRTEERLKTFLDGGTAARV
jgi:Ser/Thr protein kinase RdoA (MazF antagonist)